MTLITIWWNQLFACNICKLIDRAKVYSDHSSTPSSSNSNDIKEKEKNLDQEHKERVLFFLFN